MYMIYVMSKNFFDLYISVRLHIRVNIATVEYTIVRRNITEFPNPNHAVSENGIYMLRNTKANRTENVMVPMS